MKKLILLSIVVLSLTTKAQNIESLSDGIKTLNYPDKYVPKIQKYTDLKFVSSNADSIVFEYFIEDDYKDNIINIFFSGTGYILKAYALFDKKGLIVVDKKKLIPGVFSIYMFTNGTNRGSQIFTNAIDSDAKKQLGNYVYFYRDNMLKFKYIGIE